jgi:hypothetical protein
MCGCCMELGLAYPGSCPSSYFEAINFSAERHWRRKCQLRRLRGFCTALMAGCWRVWCQTSLSYCVKGRDEKENISPWHALIGMVSRDSLRCCVFTTSQRYLMR